MKTKTTYAVAALITAAFTSVHAGQPATALQATTPSLPTLHGGFGVDVSSGFVTKGIQRDTNLVSLPYFSLSLPTEVNAFGIDSASLNFATRQATNPRSTANNWFRSDYTAGVTFNSGSFSVTPSYQFVNAPNGNRQDYQEIGINAVYRDGGVFGLPSLNPSASVVYGTKGTPGLATGAGTFYELGITPTFNVSTTTVTLPVRVGLGGNNLYANNQRYGYTSAGLATKTPLLKNVFLNSGVTYFNADKGLNQDTNSFWLVSGGLGVEF